MAVTHADISRLSSQAAQLSEQTADARKRIESARQQTIAENRAMLEKLRQDTSAALEEREQAVLEKYNEILSRTVSEQERQLKSELNRLQSEYDDVCARIREETAVRRMEAEQLLVEQKEFERAFFERRSFLEEYAGNVYRQTADEFGRFSGSVPADWFLKGHKALYAARLSEVLVLIDNGLYESAAAVCENMKLNIRIDEISIMDSFEMWQRYYMIFADMLSAAGDLIFSRALHIPEDMLFVNKAFDINGGVISRELVNTWTNGRYEDFVKEYEIYYELLRPFRSDGVPVEAEKLMEFMIEKPQLSSALSIDELYRNTEKLRMFLKNVSCCISGMHSAVRAFDERLGLIYLNSASADKRGLYYILEEAGYEMCWMTGAEDGRLDGTVTAGFSDNNNVMEFEVMITPVQRLYDGRWINLADWYYPQQASSERVEELAHLMAEAFTAKGIHTASARMLPEQETEARIREVSRNRRLMINGRIN